MKRIAIIALAAVMSATAYAGANTLDSLAAAIADSSPALQQLRHSYEAELEEARAANALQGIEADFDYKFGSQDDRWGVAVSQGFDWPGVYSARRKANGFRADAYRYLYAGERADRVCEASQALIEYAAAEGQLQLLNTSLDNVNELRAAYSTAFEKGAATILEVRKLELEAFATEGRVADARQRLNSARAALLALGAEVPAAVPALPAYSVADVEGLTADNNPALRAAGSLADAARADISAARRSALPSFKVGFVHDYEDGQHFNGFSVGISLPSWSPRHSVAAARSRALAAEAAVELAVPAFNARVNADRAEAVALAARIAFGADLFGSDDYPALLRKALDRRAMTLPEYLREYNDYLEAKAEYIDMQARLASLYSSLKRYSAY